jgi:predicted RNase H-like HicB family nuclease
VLAYLPRVPKKYGEVRKRPVATGWSRVRERGSHEASSSSPAAARRSAAARSRRPSRRPRAPRRDSSACRYACGDAPGDRTGRPALREYLVIYEQGDDGAWGAHSPDVEGVFALGVTREEAEARMAEALTAHLESLREQGAEVPEPHTDAGRVAA